MATHAKITKCPNCGREYRVITATMQVTCYRCKTEFVPAHARQIENTSAAGTIFDTDSEEGAA